MANEFVAKNGLISQNNSTVSGSLTVTQGITGSFSGSVAGYVANSQTSSFATTGSNTFSSTQTINGNLFLSGSFRLVYNNDPATNMLFGQFDGSTIHGPYFQSFGYNYTDVTQRGSAEFVYDTRNSGGSGFNVASFNGSTWTRRFRVIDSGTEVTGSFTVVTGSSVKLQVTNTGVKIGSVITDTHTVTGSVGISGSITFTTASGNINGVTATEMGYLSGVTSNIQTQLNNRSDVIINAYQALGSSVKAQAMGLSMTAITSTNTVLSGAQSFMRAIPIYLQSTQTLNGVIWYQAVAGAYTATNENRIALYSYSAGTASLVASSTNDANIWSSSYSAGQLFVTKSFSSSIVASPGVYYIGLLAASSATSTSPTIGAGANLVVNNVGLRQLDFTNGALTYGIRATVTSLPGSFIVGTYLNALTQNIPFAAVY